MGLFKTLRRKQRDRHPFPDEWRRLLDCKLYHYQKLGEGQRRKLEQSLRHFMAEKSFEGCGGMELDLEKQLLISALACIPLLGGTSDLYPALRAILVYPSSYEAPCNEPGIDGVVTEGVESRSGESWDQGVIVFSWKEVEYDLRHPRDGANIVFHECAHQLDYEWGATMESYIWYRSANRKDELAAILKKEYKKLVDRVERGRAVEVDEYAATNIHEFFAVMTETWLERPNRIRRAWPDVDKALSEFYNFKPQD